MSMKKSSHKILKSVALAGALTATGAVATTAHADTAKASAPVQGVASTDQQLTNLKSQQTANESAVASSNAATMSAATTSANSQIADLNNQIKERQASDAAVQQASQASAIAQVNSEAASATAAENASYSQAVASQTAVNDAALKSAQATIVTEQQKNQETAQENTDYQKQADNLYSEHNTALNKLDQDLKNNTDSTNIAIQKEVERQKATQQAAMDRTAKQFDNQIADANSAVNDAQKAVNYDQQDVNAKNVVNTAVQQAVKNAQDKLSGAQDALKKLEDANISQIVKINKDQWYQAYNDWYTTGGYKGGTITDTDAQNLVRMGYSDNQYQSNEQDASKTIDSNNLTDAQLKEINVFGANILNQIRTQLGLAPVAVTQGSIDFAKAIAKSYKNDNWDPSHGHYDRGIGKAAEQYGLLGTGNYYECLGSGYHINTMNDLKRMVYNDILIMTVGCINKNATGNGNLDGHGGHKIGIEFAHANGLLGYPHDNPSGYTEDFALDTNIHGGTLDHLITVPTDKKHSYYWTDPTKYDRTEIPLGQNDRQQLQAAVNTDTQALNDAKSKANTTASDLKSAQDKLTSDSAKLSQAQAHVNDLKANKDQTLKAMATDPMQSPAVKKLQNKLTDIKQQHDTAVKAENDQYIAKVSDLKAKHEAKLAEIAAQPTSLAELQSQLQAKLDTLKSNHDAKLKQINDDADAKIEAIKNQKVDDPEIDKLNAQIDQIKSDLAKKQQELDNQYEALKTKNQAEYNALANKLNPSTKAVANGSTQQVFTSRSGKVTYVVPSQQSLATKGVVKTVSEQNNSDSLSKEFQSQNNNRLPQTGNQSSLAMVLLGAAAAMFGVGLAGKKKEY
ncbi:hypothetical protein BFD03_03605 [Limosilactobacillus reuteri]|uniref:Gram-positive cocci surface proteins LPxTG domain-containing protein n=1 Tax=Limosilactobacillus reuteri TaxID=1598 RepID=A0A1C2GCW0_LIMRT|nr:SEC10/PgrA surface exclusion domain-containing protein [Limosilactobacillus reuteri]OCX49314.1 hypothetical protein BFD03_03605 [Limosilactobacillus reuteri]WPC93665.1 SEC10/PgrA surface exclusion domain-containing protein [Limosilactobacillus reuteri]